MKTNNLFVLLSQKVSYATGHPAAFFMALSVVAIWAITGPIFEFNNTWQLVINTGTTIITFLMVFLIQSTQNRDTAALQLKLDELIRVTDGAHTVLLDLEELSEDQLQKLRRQYENIAGKARQDLRNGLSDSTSRPYVDLSILYREDNDKKG